MMQSFALLLVAIFGLFLPVLIQHKTDVQQKPATTCLAEAGTAANAANHAKGTTQNSTVEHCGGGTAMAKTAPAPPRASSTNGAATSLHASSPTAAVETGRVHHRHGRRSHARARLENAASPAATADRGAGF